MAKDAWYSRSFRRNLVDMHIDGWNPEFLSRFDETQYFECLKAAKIQSPMIYTHSHVGLCNWDSASGETHPAFRANNRIRRLFDLCHGEGMDVVAYYSLIYNNWAHERHPEWRMVDAKGRHTRSEGGRYGLVCPNSPGYREFLRLQFAELCAAYEFEGVFLDMTFWLVVCCCDSCRERYRREAGREIPAVVDWDDPEWRRFQRAREGWMSEFAAFCTAELKRLRPGVTVEHQFSTMSKGWLYGVTEGVGDASDYCGGDLYGGFLQQSYVCKLYWETTRNQPFEYMTSRCDPGLHDHTTTKDADALRQHNFLALAHRGAFLAIDAIDPAGTLDARFYSLLGEVFCESIPFEPHLYGRLVADVAVLMSFHSKLSVHEPKAATETVDWDHGQLQENANIGAAAALLARRHCFTVLPCSRLDRLAGKKVAMLTEAPFLDDGEIECICRFVQEGGALYASGCTSPALLERLLGLVHRGYTAEDVTYIAPTEEGQPFFGPFTAGHPMAFRGRQAVVDAPKEHRILATVTLPYTNPSDGSRFASIHSNPPGVPTGLPSVVLGRHGRGLVLWSAAGFERNPQRAHREVLANLVDLLHGGPRRIETDAPAFVELLLFDDAERARLTLNCVNTLEVSPAVAPGGFSVRLRTDRPVRAVSLLPEGRPVPFEPEDGGVAFRVEGMRIFTMVALDY